jgi:hypothetical protein
LRFEIWDLMFDVWCLMFTALEIHTKLIST